MTHDAHHLLGRESPIRPRRARTLSRLIQSALVVGNLVVGSLVAAVGWGQTPQASPMPHYYQSAVDNYRDLDRFGSPKVPMDSWIYPALERLSTMGLVPSQMVDIRPWTRNECLRQLSEAEDQLDLLEDRGESPLTREARRLIPDLKRELGRAPESGVTTLESAYLRFGAIAGPAVTDSFHFGQTWWNDFGRPLGRGSSVISGFSARASRGRYFLYGREEVQHGPGSLAVSPGQAQLFFNLDAAPFLVPPGIYSATSLAVPAYNRVRPIELYAGAAFAGNEVSFGKQELFWGPTTLGPLSFSSNAEPTYNLRIDSVRPHPFPFLSRLGTYRFDLVFGKLSGHHYPARPYFNGEKITLNLFSTLELGFTRWSILWGLGHPMTLHSLKENLFSFNSTGSGVYGTRDDPGDRKSAFDLRLHVPGLGHRLTLYTDAYADDEPSPIDAPRRVVWSPGVYLARVPYLSHADLRFEMVSTEELSNDEGGTRFFINNQYLDGNTNKGFLLGTAAGRDARVFEARSGYWFSARTRVEAGFRQNKGSNEFLLHGATITDEFVNASWAFRPEWTVNLFAQHERFLIPAMSTGTSLPLGPHTNQSGWLQISWTPKLTVPRQSTP